MQHKLLVIHSQALVRANLRAKTIHGLHHRVPLLKTAPKALQVESGNGNCPRDDRVNDGTTVTYHKKKPSVGKHSSQFVGIFQRERILVAKMRGWLSMLGNDLRIQLIQLIKTPSQKQPRQIVLFKIKLCLMLFAQRGKKYCYYMRPTHIFYATKYKYTQYINMYMHTHAYFWTL